MRAILGDMLTQARQTRPHLYALEFEPSPPPVEEEHCLETGGLELDIGLARKAVAGPDCFRAGQSPHGC